MIAVTGASGFVGRSLVRSLAASGIGFIGVARSAAPNVVQCDFTDSSVLARHFENCDAVIHLASSTPCQSVNHVEGIEAITARVLNAAVSAGVRRFVHFSSVKVFPESVNGLVLTGAEPAPVCPYGRSKLKAEELVLAQVSRFADGVNIVRPPLIYGVGVRGKLGLLVKAADLGVPLPLMGLPPRTAISVVKLIEGLIPLLSEVNGKTYIYPLASHDVSLSTIVMESKRYPDRSSRFWRMPKILINRFIGDKFLGPSIGAFFIGSRVDRKTLIGANCSVY